MTTRKEPTVAERIGRAAKERRLELGLRLVDVAKKARLDKGSLSRIENAQIGPRGLGAEKVARLAKALSMEPGELFGHAATVTETKQ